MARIKTPQSAVSAVAQAQPSALPGKRLRGVSPPTMANKLRRLMWNLVQSTLFRWSPVPLHAWRRALLRFFGAKIDRGVHPYPDAKIWAPWNLEMAEGSCLGPRVVCYNVGPIRLGRNALVSQGAHLCAATHDHRDPKFSLLIGVIDVGDDAWIAADAFVGPGVFIGARAVVGACAVAMKDVCADDIVIGNPARVISQR